MGPISGNVYQNDANTPLILPSTTEMMYLGNIISGTPVRQDGNKLPSLEVDIVITSILVITVDITVISSINNCNNRVRGLVILVLYASIMLALVTCVHIRMCTSGYDSTGTHVFLLCYMLYLRCF